MRRSIVTILLLVLAACADSEASGSASPSAEAPSPAASASLPPTGTPSAAPTPEQVAVLVAAGDIASCDGEGDSKTAQLIVAMDDDVVVATLGDNVYPTGSDATYAECYDPAWGSLLERTRPAIGNHDAEGDGGAAYHAYFGQLAGTSGAAWYSYEIGDWHVIVLDSNCGLVGCDPGTPQHDWLVADLAASDATCTLAYWHHPRFTSGLHGEITATGPFWDALDAAGADLVLAGHDHHYERFAPQAADGSPDPDGIRELIVGTGGADLYPTTRVAPNSERIIVGALGVVELTLHDDSYDWRFLTIDGAEADAGSADCH